MAMRSVVGLGLLVGGASAALPADVAAGFFAGRSGDVLLKPVRAQAPAETTAIFADTSGALRQGSSAPATLSAYNVADVVARSLGVAPVNTEYEPEFMQQSAFALRAKANLLVHVVGLSASDARAQRLPALQKLQQGVAFKVSSPSFPSSDLALSVSLATGAPPAQHGVIGSQWLNARGERVQALSADASSWSSVANVADRLHQSFPGQSLSVSASSDPALASAFGVHPSLAAKFPAWRQSTVTVSGANTELRQQLAAAHGSVLPALSASGISVAFAQGSSDTVNVAYTDAQGAAQQVSFRLGVKEDATLFLEAQHAYSLAQALAGADAKMQQLAQDSAPDHFAVSLAATKQIAAKYGAESPEAAGAARVTDATVATLLQSFAKAYPDRLFSEVVLQGAAVAPSSEARSLYAQVREQLPVGSLAQFLEFYPAVYLDAKALASRTPESLAKGCSALDSQLREKGVAAYCPSAGAAVPVGGQFQRQEAMMAPQVLIQQQSFGNSTGHAVSINDIARYQIVLWLAIGVSLALVVTVYSLAFMPFKKDTLLYSTFNAKWEDRKRR